MAESPKPPPRRGVVRRVSGRVTGAADSVVGGGPLNSGVVELEEEKKEEEGIRPESHAVLTTPPTPLVTTSFALFTERYPAGGSIGYNKGQAASLAGSTIADV